MISYRGERELRVPLELLDEPELLEEPDELRELRLELDLARSLILEPELLLLL